jgi:hypothetical protein
MKKIIALSKQLKKFNLSNEQFVLSYCLAKIASEQLELFKIEDLEYKCLICGDVKIKDEIEFIDSPGRLISSGYTPKYVGVNTVCKDCVKVDLSYILCPICGAYRDHEDTEEIDRRELYNKDAPLYDLPEDYKYRVCSDCFLSIFNFICADCNEIIKEDEETLLNNKDERICNGCSERYINCYGCSSLISIEDGCYRIIDDELYCEHCVPENPNDIATLNSIISDVGKNNNYLSGPTHILLGKNIINILKERLEHVFRRFHTEKFATQRVSEDIKNFIEKTKSIQEKDKPVVIKLLFSNDNLRMDAVKDLLLQYKENKNIEEEFSSLYAPVKDLKIIKNLNFSDVNFSIKSAADDTLYLSFEVIMFPNNKIINTAEEIFGPVGPLAWEMMSSWGTVHKMGSIAYARISDHDGDWIIDNFQRDSDLYNFNNLLNNSVESKTRLLSSFADNNGYNDIQVLKDDIYVAANWFDWQFKSWAPQMLLAIQAMARTAGVKLYMTPFELQEKKWSSIPRRNKDVYDRLPEELGKMNEEAQKNIPEGERNIFPRMVDISGKTEESGQYNLEYNRLWRIANRRKILEKVISG